jgi:succinate dehydrogenase / fumarate reductase flavoprotein subunit
MSESLRNDGRIWVPKKAKSGLTAKEAVNLPEDERDYYLERRYPAFGNLVPRDVASRNAKIVCDEGRGVGGTGQAVFLDFSDAINRLGKDVISEKYGNLFDMYQQIQGDNPYEMPMMIYPAVHYTMGGLWVDYNLMTNIDGLYALGECNFSDHGANRLGASALMQGLADGYFVIPYTIGDYLAGTAYDKIGTGHEEFKKVEVEIQERITKLLNINGDKTIDEFHKELGHVMWEYVGMARNEEGLKIARQKIKEIKASFWQNVKVLGENEEMNLSLEKAGRVADFIELAELMVDDAQNRRESCGGHFREESQTEEGEAKRIDDEYSYVAAWKYQGEGQEEELVTEDLEFENVKLTQRSYK